MIMERNWKNGFGLFNKEIKTVPAIGLLNEQSREGLPKAYIPKFLYKPPFGFPRFSDLPNIRRLAASPFVEMVISLIIDEISGVEWNIIAEDKKGNPIEGKDDEIEHVNDFFENPNTNKESWEQLMRKVIRDILEVDSGVLIKMFNAHEEMVEVVARDGVTFTKNPDIYGMMTDRIDLMIDKVIGDLRNKEMRLMEPGWINAADAREQAAYFQYGWISGARPVPFGKRELVWFEKNVRSDSIYSRSPIENLASTIQTLIYSIEHNLEYFSDNSIPPGILGLDGSSTDEVKAFQDQWKEQQRIKDNAGNWKKAFHKIPIVNRMPKFEKLGFTNAELQLLEGQKWWARIVWWCFGANPSEIGDTSDAKGMGNQIVQSNTFRKRAINPLLRLLEYKINHEIISEFSIPSKTKFIEDEIKAGKTKLEAEKNSKKTSLPYEDIRFKYKMFDVEEETKKATLYKLQIDSGIRTVNEVRNEEGLEDVEWGNDDPKRNQGNNINFGNPADPQKQEQGKLEKQTDINKEKKKEVEKVKEKKPEKKDNPLIPKENEEVDEKLLEKSIVYLLKENEELVKDLLEKEYGSEQLMKIKSIDDIAKAIKRIVSFEGLKGVSDRVIKHTFMGGWDKAEKQLDMNFMVNKGAIDYLQDYTFNNIKDMTEEIKNDLRAELERGIMSGEGINNLKARITKVFDKGENRATMIARTETTRALNQGGLQAMKSSEKLFMKRWLAHKDDRTSAICMRLNGQTIEINENFKDSSGWEGPCPPSHVNCRSTLVYISKDELKNEEAEKKAISEDLDIKLKEKELDIKNRKEKLLEKLEGQVGNKDIPGQSKAK